MIDNKRVVALLPMKAHSARVPRKNFRNFAGKPLFRWILDSLLAMEEVDEVIINTDAREVLEKEGLVEQPRLRLRDRRPEICGDDVSMNLVLADDVAHVEADIYLMTHTTNPLLGSATMSAALSAFKAALDSGAHDSLFTVNRVQTRFYREDVSPVNHDPGNLIPTQNLEPWFEENSNLYLFTAESFASTGARIGSKPMMFPTPKLESCDIDTPEDWDLGEVIATWASRR